MYVQRPHTIVTNNQQQTRISSRVGPSSSPSLCLMHRDQFHKINGKSNSADRYLTTKSTGGDGPSTTPTSRTTAAPATTELEKDEAAGKDAEQGRFTPDDHNHHQEEPPHHHDSWKPSGGRGACRATAPSIAPPKQKVLPGDYSEEPSERDNAKRILRTLATHLWPSKELQVVDCDGRVRRRGGVGCDTVYSCTR